MLPQPGDIIVHRQIHSPAVYILSRWTGPLQLTYESCNEALQQARAVASELRLDAWYTTDEHAYERIAQHRNRS